MATLLLKGLVTFRIFQKLQNLFFYFSGEECVNLVNYVLIDSSGVSTIYFGEKISEIAHLGRVLWSLGFSVIWSFFRLSGFLFVWSSEFGLRY